MKKKTLIIFGIVFVGLIGIILILNLVGLLSVVGVSSDLDYSTEWKFGTLDKGIGVTEATLKLPRLTNEFSFTVDYGGEIESKRDYGTCYVDVDYEIFNFKTNSWKKFHDKSWSFKEYDIRASELNFDGENIYQNGVPERIATILTRESTTSANRRYDSYWSCLSGMSVSQMLGLIEYARESDSRYTFKCLYPDNYISEHEVDDEYWEYNDLIYFPKLNIYGINYIENNTAKLKITVNKKSNCQFFSEDDFEIELFDVKTELETYYRFLNNECNEVQIFTYQKTVNDYEKLIDCQENILLDKWVLTEGVCSLEKVKFTEIDSNMFDTLAECQASIKPPTPSISPLTKFFQSIWEWIKGLFQNV